MIVFTELMKTVVGVKEKGPAFSKTVDRTMRYELYRFMAFASPA